MALRAFTLQRITTGSGAMLQRTGSGVCVRVRCYMLSPARACSEVHGLRRRAQVAHLACWHGLRRRAHLACAVSMLRCHGYIVGTCARFGVVAMRQWIVRNRGNAISRVLDITRAGAVGYTQQILGKKRGVTPSLAY